MIRLLQLFVCLIAYRVCFCNQDYVEVGRSIKESTKKDRISTKDFPTKTNPNLPTYQKTFQRNRSYPPDLINTLKYIDDCSRCGRSISDCTSCATPLRETRCQKERRKATEKSKRGIATYLHVPTCKADGGFQEVQCHDMMGYCWCVNEEGKPLPKTSAIGREKIKCRSIRNGHVVNVKKRRGLKLKGCQQKKRNDFNSNLINLFREELLRQQGPSQSTVTNSSNLTHTRKVAEWKFNELDKDDDRVLFPHELQAFKVMAKKVVKPVLCASDFPGVCDKNEDDRIVLEEWVECLQFNEIPNSSRRNKKVEYKHKHENRFPISLHSWPSDGTKKRKQIHKLKEDSREPSILDLMIISGGYRKLSQQMDRDDKRKHNKLKSGDKNTKERKITNGQQQSSLQPQSTTDCFSERRRATQLDKDNPRGHIYVPNCDPATGLYTRAQCHTSTRYCWCVDPKTGIAIPGVATQNVTPNCEEIELLSRTMPGCPLHLKRKLLNELLDITTQKMADAMSSGASMKNLEEPDPSHSIEERAVRWKFKTLDSNNDSLLETLEIKRFRAEMKRDLAKNEKLLRHCGRKFVNFCDVDRDDIINMKEWIDCYGLNELAKISSNPTKRSGRNPFTTMLT